MLCLGLLCPRGRIGNCGRLSSPHSPAHPSRISNGDPLPDIIGQSAYCLAGKVGPRSNSGKTPLSTARSQEVR